MANVTQTSTGVEVSYPTREAQQTITRAEYDLCKTIDNKVQAIKFLRVQYDLGLYEAKQIVDTIKALDITSY